MPAAKCEYSSRGTLSWHCFENTDKNGRHNRTCAMPGQLTVTDVAGVKPISIVERITGKPEVNFPNSVLSLLSKAVGHLGHVQSPHLLPNASLRAVPVRDFHPVACLL